MNNKDVSRFPLLAPKSVIVFLNEFLIGRSVKSGGSKMKIDAKHIAKITKTPS